MENSEFVNKNWERLTEDERRAWTGVWVSLRNAINRYADLDHDDPKEWRVLFGEEVSNYQALRDHVGGLIAKRVKHEIGMEEAEAFRLARVESARQHGTMIVSTATMMEAGRPFYKWMNGQTIGDVL